MGANGRYNTTDSARTIASAGGAGRLSTSDTARMQAMFASSPIYNGYDRPSVQALGIYALQTGVVNDSGHTFGLFDRDFTGVGASSQTPDLAAVVTGPGGLPGTPYTPNTASPGEGNGVNYTALPVPPPTDAPGDNGSLASPSSTTQLIAAETFAQYGLGVRVR